MLIILFRITGKDKTLQFTLWSLLCLVPKPDTDRLEKGNCKPIVLPTKNVKIQNKALVNEIWQNVFMIKWDLS